MIMKNSKENNKIILNDEYIDCLLRITKVLRHKTDLFFVEIKTQLLLIINKFFDKYNNEKDKYISISTKSRFLLLNIQDYLKGL
jgi:hypothetical protein